jgi:hypothetical protein
MKTFIDFDALKDSELYLHTLLSRATGFDSGQHEVDIAAINILPQYRMRIAEWVTLHTPAPVVAPTPAEPQVSMAQIEADNNADIQRRIDKARAIQRANDYVRDAGLAESDANGKLIREWIENAGGHWTPELVDAAIVALNDHLEWAKEETPAEVLATLPDGKTQLPLDATPSMLRRASLPQLHDWHKRKQAATPVTRIAGRFAGNIF